MSSSGPIFSTTIALFSAPLSSFSFSFFLAACCICLTGSAQPLSAASGRASKPWHERANSRARWSEQGLWRHLSLAPGKFRLGGGTDRRLDRTERGGQDNSRQCHHGRASRFRRPDHLSRRG